MRLSAGAAQWDLLAEDWLEQALADNAKPLRGARGPLTRIRPRPGQPAADQPHYRLADYLEQYGRTRRRTARIPAALWNALLAHAPATNRSTLAQAAHRRGLLGIAIGFYASAADAGDTKAPKAAALLLVEAGRWEEALSWFERAADAGDVKAPRAAAHLLAAA